MVTPHGRARATSSGPLPVTGLPSPDLRTCSSQQLRVACGPTGATAGLTPPRANTPHDGKAAATPEGRLRAPPRRQRGIERVGDSGSGAAVPPVTERLQGLFTRFGRAHSTNTLSIATNAIWLFVDRASRIVIALVLGSWVARHLGPERYGLLAFTLTVYAFLQILVSLGLDGVAVREMTQRRVEERVSVGVILTLRFVMAMVGLVGVTLYVAFVSAGEEARWILLAAALALPFFAADSFDFWFQSRSENRVVVQLRFRATLLSSAFRVLLILVSAPIYLFAAAVAVDAAAVAYLLARAYKRNGGPRPLSFSPAQAADLLRESWPLLLAALATTVYMRIDQLLVLRYLGDAALGQYAAAVTLSTAPYVLSLLVQTSVLPFFSTLHQRDPALFANRLQLLFDLSAAVGAFMALSLVFMSGPVVRLLLGAQYAPTAGIMAIYAFTNVFVFLGVAQLVWITVERRSSVSLAKTVIGAVAAIVLNWQLLPRFGMTGGALAAVGTQFISAVLCNAFLAPEIFRMQVRALFPLHRARALLSVRGGWG